MATEKELIEAGSITCDKCGENGEFGLFVGGYDCDAQWLECPSCKAQLKDLQPGDLHGA